jgi:hypothetical protein
MSTSREALFFHLKPMADFKCLCLCWLLDHSMASYRTDKQLEHLMRHRRRPIYRSQSSMSSPSRPGLLLLALPAPRPLCLLS